MIKALEDGVVPVFSEARLKAIHDFTVSALRGETPSDSEFDDFVQIISRAGIADILADIGYFTSVSLAMKVHAICRAGNPL